jgi:hypothetical protein
MTNQKYFRFQSADIEELFTEGDILLIRNDSFMAEVEALRKDAARYRWLKKLRAFEVPDVLRGLTWVGANRIRHFRQGQLDEVIDAEMETK